MCVWSDSTDALARVTVVQKIAQTRASEVQARLRAGGAFLLPFVGEQRKVAETLWEVIVSKGLERNHVFTNMKSNVTTSLSVSHIVSPFFAQLSDLEPSMAETRPFSAE